MTRLFFAVMLTAAQQQQLHAWLQTVALPADARIVPAEQLHLTLAFLGETPSSAVPAIVAKIHSLRWQRFALTLNQIEHWMRGKVVCLCAPSVPLALQTVVNNLRNSLQQLNLQPDLRAYHPHITLLKRVSRWPTNHPTSPSITLAPQTFCLVESNDQHPSTYTILHQHPFTA